MTASPQLDRGLEAGEVMGMAPCPGQANAWARRAPTTHASCRSFPDNREPDVLGCTGMPDGAIALPAAPGGAASM